MSANSKLFKLQSESCDSGDWGWAGLEEAGGGGPKVPGLVSACLAHLRRHGLRTLGLFRVSASKKRVRQVGGNDDYKCVMKNGNGLFTLLRTSLL